MKACRGISRCASRRFERGAGTEVRKAESCPGLRVDGSGAAAAGSGFAASSERLVDSAMQLALPWLTGLGVRGVLNSYDEETQTRATIALCRCGASKNKPCCDGSHDRIGFSDQKRAGRVQEQRDMYEGEGVTIDDNRGADLLITTRKAEEVLRRLDQYHFLRTGSFVEHRRVVRGNSRHLFRGRARRRPRARRRAPVTNHQKQMGP